MLRSRIPVLALILAATAAASVVRAAAPSGKPEAAERPFVSSVMADLAKRFPTAADAERAGYHRYTNEDHTGAISYENGQWSSADGRHPSQLWYDVKGRLLGADFSVLKSQSPQPPKRWSIEPARWSEFPAHVHYIVRKADGSLTYSAVENPQTIAKAGGSMSHPTKAFLVRLGIAPDERHVVYVFPFPDIWDLTVWVRANPAGAFADANPNVHPAHAHTDSM